MSGSRKRWQFSKSRAILVLAGIVLCVGICFAAAPSSQHRESAKIQTTLLDSIQQGDGTLKMEKSFAALRVDFYDNDHTLPLEANEIHESNIITGIGILQIDRIHLQLPVTEGFADAQLKVSVGHVPQTAAVGAQGNAVLVGHRSYSFGHLFNRLGEVVVGDIIEYQPKDSQTLLFTVEEIFEILPEDQNVFSQPSDKTQITLYTCTPIYTAMHRLIIRASLSI